MYRPEADVRLGGSGPVTRVAGRGGDDTTRIRPVPRTDRASGIPKDEPPLFRTIEHPDTIPCRRMAGGPPDSVPENVEPPVR